MMKKIGIVIVAFALSATVISAPVHAETNPYGVSTIDPAPASQAILTLTNKDMVKKYRVVDLQKFKTTEIKIFEPFVKRNQTFTVIPLQTLFAQVGIKSGDLVITKALNDYVYKNTAGNFQSAHGYLAIAREGKAIPYDQGGPIRIIFPTKSKWAKFLDPWNWSLMSIAVQ